jgi:hypothetical protein
MGPVDKGVAPHKAVEDTALYVSMGGEDIEGKDVETAAVLRMTV